MMTALARLRVLNARAHGEPASQPTPHLVLTGLTQRFPCICSSSTTNTTIPCRAVPRSRTLFPTATQALVPSRPSSARTSTTTFTIPTVRAPTPCASILITTRRFLCTTVDRRARLLTRLRCTGMELTTRTWARCLISMRAICAARYFGCFVR